MSNGIKSNKVTSTAVGCLASSPVKTSKMLKATPAAQVFCKGGVKQQFAGKQKLYANSVQFKDELKGTSGYYGLGFEANPNKKVSLMVSSNGKTASINTKETREVMLGLRCSSYCLSALTHRHSAECAKASRQN